MVGTFFYGKKSFLQTDCVSSWEMHSGSAVGHFYDNFWRVYALFMRRNCVLNGAESVGKYSRYFNVGAKQKKTNNNFSKPDIEGE